MVANSGASAFGRRMKVGLRAKILTGIVVLVPVVVTFLVLRLVFQWTDGLAQPLIKQVLQRQTDIPGLGIGLTVMIVWLTGMVAGNVFGRRLVHRAGNLLSRLPIIGAIYAPVKQFIETLVSPDEHLGFRRVVLAEYPSEGLWILGFGTGNVKLDESGKMGRCVFVPTSPNPATGWMVIVPSDRVRNTNLTVEEAMRLIVSGGIVVPDRLRDLSRYGLTDSVPLAVRVQDLPQSDPPAGSARDAPPDGRDPSGPA